jgi:glycosyltransferase involved in cell wall biosynthesis
LAARVPEATVVVPTRDRAPALARCLEALAAQSSTRPFEIIVADDSRGAPAAVEEAARAVGARVVRSKGSGPAAARNRGIEAARAPLVLFTDDDTIPDSHWVEAACRFLGERPAYVGVSGVTESPTWDPLYERSVESTSPAFWTCNICYRREILQALEGFSEAFPWPHAEDLDLGYRALEFGPVGFEPGMRVLHPPQRLTLLQLLGRARFVASDVLIVFRHAERYRCPRLFPRRLLPIVGLAKEWWRMGARERSRLVRRPARAGRFVLAAVGQLGIGLAVALATRAPREAGR